MHNGELLQFRRRGVVVTVTRTVTQRPLENQQLLDRRDANLLAADKNVRALIFRIT
jgi:hypothetical protein